MSAKQLVGAPPRIRHLRFPRTAGGNQHKRADENHARDVPTADIKLRPTKNLAKQLTNAEWLASFPGTDTQKKGAAQLHQLTEVRLCCRSSGASQIDPERS